MKLKKALSDNWALIVVLIVAFLFRGLGVTWGFPFTLNNDESALVRSALGMRFGDFNPHYFDWPSLYRYINFSLFWLFIKFRVPFQLTFGVETMRRLLPFFWNSDPLPFYFLARLLTATLGTATVYLVYRIGKKFFSESTGLFAALFLAVNSNHVINSQIATLDVGMTFFFAVGLFFAVRILDNPQWKNYLLAGLFLGLATSTKYNAGLLCLVIVAASFLSTDSWQNKIKKLAGSAGVSLLAFLAGTPYAILDWGTFWQKDDVHGFLWTFDRAAPGNKWWWLFESVFLRAWGLPLGLLIVGGYLLFVYKSVRGEKLQRKLSLVMLIFPTLYFLYLGSWWRPRSQYMLPMYLFESLFAAQLFLVFRDRVNQHIIMAIFLVFLLAIPVYQNILLDYQKLVVDDTRTQASCWIADNIPENSSLGGVGKIVGDYGGNVPYIRTCSQAETDCYRYQSLGINIDSCNPESWSSKLSSNRLDYLVFSQRSFSDCFTAWLENVCSFQKKFVPVYVDVCPTVVVCKTIN